MRFFSALGMVGVLLLATAAQGAPVIRNTSSDRPEDHPQIRVVSSSDQGVSLLFELPTLTVEDVTNAGETFQLVTIPGGNLEGDLGAPALPTYSRFLAIPNDAAVSIQTITPEGEEDLTGIHLLPMQADEGSEFALDVASYGHDAFDDAPAVRVGSPAIARDLRLVTLTFRPIRYNPARRTLRVAQQVRVDVSFRGKSEENVLRSHRTTLAPTFDSLYRELVINYSGPPVGTTIQNGTYLIICPNDNGVTTPPAAARGLAQAQGLPRRSRHDRPDGDQQDQHQELDPERLQHLAEST